MREMKTMKTSRFHRWHPRALEASYTIFSTNKNLLLLFRIMWQIPQQVSRKRQVLSNNLHYSKSSHKFSPSIQSPTRVTQSSSFVTQSSTSVTQPSSHVTQSSSPVTQSSSFLTRSSAPISVSVTQTSALSVQPLVSLVPAVTQSSVSVSQSLPPVTHHSAYLGGYTSSTPMTPHSAYLTTSLQQGLVTSPVMYQQAYQDFTPQSLYGSPPLYVLLQSQPPQPSPM